MNKFSDIRLGPSPIKRDAVNCFGLPFVIWHEGQPLTRGEWLDTCLPRPRGNIQLVLPSTTLPNQLAGPQLAEVTVWLISEYDQNMKLCALKMGPPSESNLSESQLQETELLIKQVVEDWQKTSFWTVVQMFLLDRQIKSIRTQIYGLEQVEKMGLSSKMRRQRAKWPGFVQRWLRAKDADMFEAQHAEWQLVQEALESQISEFGSKLDKEAIKYLLVYGDKDIREVVIKAIGKYDNPARPTPF